MSSKANIVFGSEYTTANKSQVFAFAPNRIGATTPGRKASIKKKMDGNEDAMAYLPQQNSELFLVADSHFGAMAANHAVSHFLQFFDPDHPEPEVALTKAHLAIDDAIGKEKLALGRDKVYPGCATTLVSAFVKDSRLYHVNSGDSRLLLFRQQQLRDLCERHDTMFLGDSVCAPQHMTLTLRKLEIIDDLTEESHLVDILGLIMEVSHLIKKHRTNKDDVAQLLARISKLAGLEFPIDMETISEPWHPIHIKTASLLPHRGVTNLVPGDVIMLVSDGIEEEVSGVSQDDLEALFANSEDLPKLADELLKKCLGRRGGLDNLTFILAKF